MTRITPAAFNVRAVDAVVDPYVHLQLRGRGLRQRDQAVLQPFGPLEGRQRCLGWSGTGRACRLDPDYAVLPSRDNAISSQNRLLVPTVVAVRQQHRQEPGIVQGQTGTTWPRRITSTTSTWRSSQFPHQQGSSDELLVLREFNPAASPRSKDGVGVPARRRDRRLVDHESARLPIGYGLVNAKAIAPGAATSTGWRPSGGWLVGSDDQQRDQGSAVPLSEPIQPWIDRINWALQVQDPDGVLGQQAVRGGSARRCDCRSLDLIEGQTYTNWLNVGDILRWTRA